jgi:hypothetical protein
MIQTRCARADRPLPMLVLVALSAVLAGCSAAPDSPPRRPQPTVRTAKTPGEIRRALRVADMQGRIDEARAALANRAAVELAPRHGATAGAEHIVNWLRVARDLGPEFAASLGPIVVEYLTLPGATPINGGAVHVPWAGSVVRVTAVATLFALGYEPAAEALFAVLRARPSGREVGVIVEALCTLDLDHVDVLCDLFRELEAELPPFAVMADEFEAALPPFATAPDEDDETYNGLRFFAALAWAPTPEARARTLPLMREILRQSDHPVLVKDAAIALGRAAVSAGDSRYGVAQELIARLADFPVAWRHYIWQRFDIQGPVN